MNTELLEDKIYNWIITVGPRLLIAIVVLVLGVWLIRLFKKWMRKGMQRKRLDPSFQPFLSSLATVSLQVILLLGIMQIVGIRMTIFTALIGAIGVAAGLALSGTMQNFASGVLILMLKPYKVGDNIIAQGQDGIVNSIQLFYTVVTTFDNRTVIIPNSKLSNEVIINISRLGKRRIDMEIKFNYGADPGQVKSVIQHTIESSAQILKDPPPTTGISVMELDGFKVMFRAWVHADAKEFEQTKFELQQQVIAAIKAAGIRLPGM
jgi:small conductance mechanosensitive channel